jgi:hypothetical protein
MSVVRAAMHVHSDWSYDGQVPLPSLAKLFAKLGYAAVFMCEHDRGFTPERKHEYDSACAAASTADTLLVPGIEYGDDQDRIHVPVWGEVPFLGEGRPTAEVLRLARDHAGFAMLAHPVRRDAWQVMDADLLALAHGIEIWTRKWDGWAPNGWAVEQARRARLAPVVSLDLHNPGQAFPLSMQLDVNGPVTVDRCVEALVDGRCHARIGRFPVAPLTSGWRAVAGRQVERARRPVFGQARIIRNRLRGGQG